MFVMCSNTRHHAQECVLPATGCPVLMSDCAACLGVFGTRHLIECPAPATSAVAPRGAPSVGRRQFTDGALGGHSQRTQIDATDYERSSKSLSFTTTTMGKTASAGRPVYAISDGRISAATWAGISLASSKMLVITGIAAGRYPNQ